MIKYKVEYELQLTIPVQSKTHQNKTGQIEAENSKESHYTAEEVTTVPRHCTSPNNLQWHHQERNLKFETKDFVTHWAN